MPLTLLCGVMPENARAAKVFVAAKHAGVDLRLQRCEYGKENETPEYARNCNPCQHYPSLQTDEGYIFESNAIMRHIARCETNGAKLYGTTPYENSQVDMWLDFAATEIDANSAPFLMAFITGAPAPAEALPALEASLAGLELWLETRTFLVNNKLSLADIAIAFALQWAYRATLQYGEGLTQKYKHAYRLYNAVMQLPETAAVLKEWGMPTGPVQMPPPSSS